MAVDKNKVIAEATKFAQRGQWDKAIRSYDRILAEDPKDVRVLLKVGELHQKRGDQAAAASTFARVAEAYTDQGFFLKAIAVYKQMMKLAPEDIRVNERLANLYQQLGIMSDAMGQLQLVAQAAERSGDGGKLLDVLRRMTDIEPDNPGSAVKLGEIYARQGNAAGALEEFRRAADVLRRNSRADEWLRVAERISFLSPDDLPLTRELANSYLARGDTKRALSKLQLCFKADPKDIETLNLLAQAFSDLGQATKTVSVYKELAHVYAERGQAEEGRTVWRRVAELAPDDPEAQTALRPAAAAPRPPAPAPQPAPAAPPAAAAPAAAPARGVGPEAIPKLLTETDVYVKYGLHQKALDHLRRVFELDPEHLDAREKSRDIRAAAGDAAGAAEEAVRAVRAALQRGAADRAAASVLRLRAIAPAHPDLGRLEAEAGVAPAGAVEEEVLVEAAVDLEPIPEILVEAAPAEGDDDVALAAAHHDDEVVADEDEAAEEVSLEEGGGPVLDDEPLAPPPARDAPIALGPPTPLAPPRRPTPPPVPVPREVRMTPPVASPRHPTPPPMPVPREVRMTPPPVAPPRHPTPPPASPPPELRMTPPPVAPPRQPTLPTMPSLPELRMVPPPAAPRYPTPVPMGPPPGLRTAPPASPASRARTTQPKMAPPPSLPPEDEGLDLTDELGEVDFFLQEGLLDEARDTLGNLLSFYPDHAGLRSRLAEVERRAAAAPAPPPPAAPAVSSADGAFDIGKELAAELGTEMPPPAEELQYSVEEVFSQFKKGVAQTVKAEDTDTHYDLGIAYKEMGLVDDALQEFETALRGAVRRRVIDCLSMIALCHMEKGDAAGAVEAWRRALRSDWLTPETARAVHYELALAFRGTGDPEAALWYLNKVVKADPAFRDAAALLASLGGGPGRPPADAEGAPSAPASAPADPRGGGAAGPKRNIGYL